MTIPRPARNHLAPNYMRAYADLGAGFASDPPGSPIPFTASTPGVKRDLLDLRPGGWRTDNFHRAGGPVLWCHDRHRPPIGNADIFPVGTTLKANVTFDQEDDYARAIESKIRRGVMRACSVGWDFVDEHGQRIDWRVTPQQVRDEVFYDLTELSIVPVGADPHALAERQRSALAALSRELRELYDDQEDPRGQVTADELQAAVRAELQRMGLDVDALRAELTLDRNILTVNEVRARQGLGEVPWGNERWAPLTKADVQWTRGDSAAPASDDDATPAEVEPTAGPEPTPQDSDATRAPEIDETAARMVLAAFPTI